MFIGIGTLFVLILWWTLRASSRGVDDIHAKQQQEDREFWARYDRAYPRDEIKM